MKFTIGDFEIKIKVRDKLAGHDKPTKNDTKLFLDYLSIKLHDKTWANDITEALQKVGYWKKENNDDVGN